MASQQIRRSSTIFWRVLALFWLVAPNSSLKRTNQSLRD
jgi:hypothetical protein